MLTKEQIQEQISGMNDYIPVSKIEENLGMPPTTLQKVLSGKRDLPKKWHKKLEMYFLVPTPQLYDSMAYSSVSRHTEETSAKKNIAEFIKNIEIPEKHKLWKEGDPPEGTNAFYIRKGCKTYAEFEILNSKNKENGNQ